MIEDILKKVTKATITAGLLFNLSNAISEETYSCEDSCKKDMEECLKVNVDEFNYCMERCASKDDVMECTDKCLEKKEAKDKLCRDDYDACIDVCDQIYRLREPKKRDNELL